MPNVRIKDQTTDTALTTGDYVIVDSEKEGTRKYDLGALAARVEALEAGQGGGSGLTDDVKTALLNCFAHVAWVDADGQDYYDALESALDSGDLSVSLMLSQVSSSNTATTVGYGESYTTTLTASTGYTLNTVTVTMGGVDVTSTTYSSGTVSIPSVTGNIVITATAVLAAQSITATYTQSGTVYDTDSLDSLKADLVVTANYSGGTSETVPASDYTLSGTLTEGTSTITVSYGGKTDTFNVVVVHAELPSGYTKYDYLTQTGFSDSFQAKAYGIWTNAQMSTDYTLEMKFFASSSAGSTGFDSPPLIGTRGGASGTKEIALFYKPKHNRLGYWFDGTDSSNQPPAPSKDVLHIIKIKPVGASATYPNNVTIDIDGTEYDTGSASTGKMFDSWFGIFTYAISSSMGITNNDVVFVGQQIGEILVTDSNGDAVYDFVPAKDSSDRYGYYEKIGGVFYYNATYAATNYIGGYWE